MRCKWLFVFALLLGAFPALAAKVPVYVVTPTEQVDEHGTSLPLKAITAIRVEWGTCTLTQFIRQSSVDYAETRVGVKVRVYAYPTGISKVCIRAYALAASAISPPSNLIQKILSAPLGAPATLEQPVRLPPVK